MWSAHAMGSGECGRPGVHVCSCVRTHSQQRTHSLAPQQQSSTCVVLQQLAAAEAAISISVRGSMHALSSQAATLGANPRSSEYASSRTSTSSGCARQEAASQHYKEHQGQA